MSRAWVGSGGRVRAPELAQPFSNKMIKGAAIEQHFVFAFQYRRKIVGFWRQRFNITEQCTHRVRWEHKFSHVAWQEWFGGSSAVVEVFSMALQFRTNHV